MSMFTGKSVGAPIVVPYVNIAVAGVANATAVVTQSTFAQLVGTKSLKIVRIRIRNNAAGNTWVHIGTGAAGTFVDLIGPLLTLNGMPTDDDNPVDAEAFATITAYPEALLAGGSVDVQIEVVERG